MTMSDRTPSHTPDQQWADDHLEAYLDGLLPEEDRQRFDRMLEADDWLQAELSRAELIQSELGAVPIASCPDFVTANVMAHARRDWWGALPRRLVQGFQRMADAGLRPALAMALLLVVVLTSTLISRPGTQSGAESAEVAQALADVKMALAVLADAGRTTGNAVGQEVIGPLVVRPMAKGMHPITEN